MTILNPPFQEFPKTDHQAYVQALATTQMQQPVGNAIIAAYGSVRDYITELYRQSIKAKLISLAPPDALTQTGRERGMPQGPQETTTAYASRLLNAFNTWPWAGTAYGLLFALSSTGYQNVVLAQVTGGKQYTLDNGGTNLSVWSADPANTSVWTLVGGSLTVTRNATTALDGTTTASKLVETAVNSIHSHAESNVPVAINDVHLYSRYVKAAERTKCFLIAANTGFPANPLVTFDLSAVTATLTAGSPISFGIQNVGSGWFRIWMAVKVQATGLGDFHLELGDGTGLRTYLGVAGNGLFMSWPQRELIVGATAASVPGVFVQTYAVNKPTALVGTLLTSTMANGIWETDALATLVPPTQSFWSKFDVIFPLPLQAPSFSWAGGIPSSVSMEANFIRAIIQAWKPAHATVNRIAIHQQGKLLGYPATQVLGASNGVLGGAATIWTP